MEDYKIYKIRVVFEYHELKERIKKLHSFIISIQNGEPKYETPTPIDILIKQENAMREYQKALEKRAEYENINFY